MGGKGEGGKQVQVVQCCESMVLGTVAVLKRSQTDVLDNGALMSK